MSHHGSEMPEGIADYLKKEEAKSVEQKKPTIEELEKLLTQNLPSRFMTFSLNRFPDHLY